MMIERVVSWLRSRTHRPEPPTLSELLGLPPTTEIDIDGYRFRLRNVHGPEKCAGQVCVIHNRTDHPMRSWPVVWRGASGVARSCPHGDEHPDPDQASYWRDSGRGVLAIHGCDGCCRPLEKQ